MPKVKISEYSATANSNTDVASINIDEGCAPSGINNAIRAIMGHLKDFQSGTSNDPFTVGSSGSLTLSYGTANGVAYLNGSKVLTTGTALVFDGTNLGVGVTPSAWYATSTKAFQVGNSSSLNDFSSSGNRQTTLANNCYLNTSAVWTYINNDPATRYHQTGGQHQWFNAPSGTGALPGNTGTQAMTLDTSGNLGIGTSSPAARLSVIAASANSTAATIGGIEYGGSKRGLTIKTFNSAGGDDCGVEFNAANGLAGYGAFKFAANTTTLATIDASGNLLVGATTVAGSAKLTVNGDISTSGTGTGARLRNQIDGVSVSTSATTIVIGGDIGQLVVVNGISGSDRFCDLVMSSTGASPVVVQSFTALGSPVARTYTRSGSDLQLAMASGTYTVRALSLGS